MSYILKKYENLKPVIQVFIDSCKKFELLSLKDKCEILLCLNDLKVDHELIKNKLDNVVLSNIENENLMTQLTRHLVLIKYNVSLDERKQFLKYWIDEKGYANVDLVSKVWIFGIASDDAELLNVNEREKLCNWFKKFSNKIKAITSIAWFPKHLETFGVDNYSNHIIEKVVVKREKNGSWIGNVNRTVRIMYSLSNSKIFINDTLLSSFNFLENKLKLGVDLNPKLASLIIKLYFISGKMESDLVNYIFESIFKNSNENLINEIIYLVTNDKIEQALDVLIQTKANKTNSVLLKRRLLQNNKAFNIGIISIEERNVEKQKIASSILQLISK